MRVMSNERQCLDKITTGVETHKIARRVYMYMALMGPICVLVIRLAENFEYNVEYYLFCYLDQDDTAQSKT
jgi:hypothetical protein